MSRPVYSGGSRVGIYGGSFDPIHRGHLRVAEVVRQKLCLDHLVFVPAQQSPLKNAAVASAVDRVAMVRLAVAQVEWASVSTQEIDRPPPSYTVDTLLSFHHEMGGADLFLVIGADLLAEFAAWRNPEAILKLASIVVIGRPGVPLAIPLSLESLNHEVPGRIVLVEASTPPISSRIIRAAIRRGEGANTDVTCEVAKYIDQHRLYRRGPAQ